MKKAISRIFSLLLVLFTAVSILPHTVRASEVTDQAVSAVISQLESIDTLQQMQDKRSQYTANSHYDANTTDTATIADHEAARAGYESYINEMFAARIAAQQAYNALSESQKAQIDASLVAKLDTYLPTTFHTGTYAVTPGNNEYTFEAVKADFGQAYEVSNHMVSGQIPQTFILVDTADGATSWTPSGMYVCGESNYEVTYCCDVETGLEYGTHYKRLNLEDSNYYGTIAAQHIRAILQNSYPFLSLEQMKANLKAGGLNAAFVDSLTRADIIAAVQMAIWTYANAGDGAAQGLGYFASIDIPKNTGIYFTPLHDYTNESWVWFPGKRQRSFDARAEYRVNTLGYYLCNLDGVAAPNDQIVISDVKVTRAELLPGADNTFNIGMYVFLNHGGSDQDNLRVTVTSYHTNADGSTSITAQNAQTVGGRTTLEMSVNAIPGDNIHVVVEGTQKLARGVYFYEPEGGRDVSQSLVGVGEGETQVRAEETFVFTENVSKQGLRIYKTENGTGLPLSDITFTIYNVVPGENETVSETPTAEEIALYKTEANKVASVTTDETGYASLELGNGIYLIVEEHNTELIKSPVHPFYIMLPMNQVIENEDGTTSTEMVSIVSVYPKNETVTPPEEPPVIPTPPDNVTGKFEILKYDALDQAMVLSGAEFEVYRAATMEDTNTQTITCNGIPYAVVPVTVGGEILVLTTDDNGRATSPALSCGTYFLVETKAPNGYNLLEEAVSVTVVSSEMTTTTTKEIANQRGSILPETGGTGTTCFWILGSILVTGSIVLLITKKRMGFYE